MKSFREALEKGPAQLGVLVMYPAPGAVERIGPDWDWMWIDGQHGELGYADILAMVRACDLVQKPAFVRVPWLDAGQIGLALDTGACGVIVPCVGTVADARACVAAAKFPPLGGRSYGARRPIDLGGRLYSDRANAETLLVAQIETPEGVENADAIAAVPGVDALFVGPDDLRLRRGLPMNAPHTVESVRADLEAVIGACKRHGKVGVMVGMDPEILKFSLALGYRMMVCGGDVPFLASGSKQAAAAARAIVQASTASRP